MAEMQSHENSNYCDVCNKNVKSSMWERHVKSKKHENNSTKVVTTKHCDKCDRDILSYMWDRHLDSDSHKYDETDIIEKRREKYKVIYNENKEKYKQYYIEHKDKLKKQISESYQRRKQELQEKIPCGICGAQIMTYSMRGHQISKRHLDALKICSSDALSN